MTTPLPPSPRRARLEVTLSNTFELWLAFAGVLSAIGFILNPEIRGLTAAGSVDHTFAWTWTLLYAAGSVGVVWGLVKLDDRIEIAGLILFVVATLVNGIAILQVRGLGSAGAYVALQYLGLSAASVVRIRNLLQLRKKMNPPKA